MNANCHKFHEAICLMVLLHLILACSWKTIEANMNCIERERQALLEFKQGLVDDYGRLSSWAKDDGDCCKWSGIQCNNKTGHVQMLDLHDYIGEQPLRGEINASLTSLYHLNYLDLSWNDFHMHQVPEFLGSLRNLRYLDLSRASFGGKIPHELGMLARLEALSLDGNNLIGEIPYQFGNLSSLQQLVLHDNNLGGMIPYQLGNFSSLEILSLGNNDNLKIGIHAQWISQLSSLKELDLGSVVGLKESKNLLKMLFQFPKLELLYVPNCSLSDMDILPLSTYGSNFSSSLARFDLSYNMFTSSIFNWLFNLSSNIHISELRLRHNLLEGPIPHDLGSTLKSLENLDLSSNKLNGTIPSSFGLLSHLRYLNLARNSLKGIISETHFANLTSLLALILSQNSITLKFSPKWIPPFQLEWLSLRYCTVGPTFPKWLQTQKNLINLNVASTGLLDTATMASFLCGANESLQYLTVANNHFVGEIPNCWNRFTFLRTLNLGNNSFSGKIPSSMKYLTQIHILVLRNNQLTGNFPSMQNCTKLLMLDVGGNELSGQVQTWVGSNLEQLQVLIMRNNLFYGNLPLSMCHLTTIQVLDLSQNNLSGEIPNCVKNLISMVIKSTIRVPINQYYTFNVDGTLHYFVTIDDFFPRVTWKGKELFFKDNQRILNLIDLSSNGFSGKIPAEIGNLVQLRSLDLSDNNLSGEIPSQIGNLHSLDFLDLSRNHLSGKIPMSLAEISSLAVLNLSSNSLSGKIPTGTQLQSFDATSYEGNAYLCGKPLEIICPDQNISGDPLVDSDSEEHQEDSFLGQGFYLSMGLGFFVGFWGVLGSLLFFHSWNHAYFNFVNNMIERLHVMKQ
ncbi:hypothetical protein RJT34_29387 [Clitoria ternatea]|uniref:Leucine-rich repeat-containing N-terminal plant-type domain-containing protein n=1 Tax=Clitoria ternatea TaxID=43366 RepID=A0AAN9F9Y1_CLITE